MDSVHRRFNFSEEKRFYLRGNVIEWLGTVENVIKCLGMVENVIKCLGTVENVIKWLGTVENVNV